MAYHSKLNEEKCKMICEMNILPIKTKVAGPAPIYSGDGEDIIDESLFYFKANVFFRNYEVKGGADRLLIYLTLYILQCLKKLQSINSKESARKNMITMSQENFSIPGERGFPATAFYSKPKNRNEADQLRQYLTQVRQEIGIRLVERVYPAPDNQLSKWWTCFTKKSFLGMNLR